MQCFLSSLLFQLTLADATECDDNGSHPEKKKHWCRTVACTPQSNPRIMSAVGTFTLNATVFRRSAETSADAEDSRSRRHRMRSDSLTQTCTYSLNFSSLSRSYVLLCVFLFIPSRKSSCNFHSEFSNCSDYQCFSFLVQLHLISGRGKQTILRRRRERKKNSRRCC